MITVEQVKAARSLLRWNQHELANTSGLAISTIRRMEGRFGLLSGYAENVWKVQRALEEAGIIFIDESDSGGVGVRLKKGPAKG